MILYSLVLCLLPKNKSKKKLHIRQYIFKFVGMMVTVKQAEKFAQMVKDADNILIVGHVNPDGDCIGSTTAMRGYLRKHKKVRIAVPTKYPEFLTFLDPENEILIYRRNIEGVKAAVDEADLIICMDFNRLYRIEELGELVRASGARKILIDHHPDPEDFADLTISETEVSSASELTYWLLKMSGLGEISVSVLNSLYTGMMTDSNNFSNSVYPSTFQMASELIAAGVDKEKIQFNVLNSYSENRMRLMGHALLNEMTVYPEFGCAFISLSKEILEKYDFQDGDTEGFVNLPLLIKGIEVSGFFREGDDYIRVSLRSRTDKFSVNDFSHKYFNGGGHERAAGGRLYMPIEDVKSHFEKAIKEYCKGKDI